MDTYMRRHDVTTVRTEDVILETPTASPTPISTEVSAQPTPLINASGKQTLLNRVKIG